MSFWQRTHEGEIVIDHRFSPGLSAEFVRRTGIDGDPRYFCEGGLFEAPTLGCVHCGAAVIINPDRKRERAHCRKCDRYICDGCAMVASQPDYVHRSFKEIVDLVQSGRFKVVGAASNPQIIPIGGDHG
jgi:hypothetical protein